MNIWDQVCFLFPSQQLAARTTVVMLTGPGRAQAWAADLRPLVGSREVRGRSGRVQRLGRAGPGLRNSHSRSLLGLKLPEEDPMG